ncbi:Uncharacterised protein [Mycobacterium tuberculosis]|uniref:Uncharacterized protein n=1 Tax=Mycobacterium tuberculosis TaxID=1773 RepID=A0A654TE78_MYCTX|nr:Uncharacterised protein [Mycobacterium tuberculosis]CKR18397.1 Uncharacterised protein [Mycobacterium tuberculosis]CKT39439.1 Uncharacterised protein [Mycobacterium tuberculosis]CKU46615.1 Uncharacterised protein [Mycobacterium tuberculosis]CNM29690.1 Uncharacterised protein [Mycobacterium tuberculosis]
MSLVDNQQPMFWQYRRFGDGIDGQQRVVGDDDIGQAGRSTSPFGEALRAKRAAGHAEAFPRRNADLRPGSVSHTGLKVVAITRHGRRSPGG